jgi:PAS domain S-box-containing protein
MNRTTDPGITFKYELFFKLSPDLLCIAGYDGFFKKINASVSKVLGYTMEELYARPINEFVYHDDQEITAKVREQLTKRKPLFNFENRYVTKSGEIVWLSWTSLPVDSDRLIFAIAKDITHKKRLEEERNALLANLTKVNKDLKQLTYTTSHDLRSPVNNLLSIFSLLDTSKISDQETLEFIEILKSSGETLKETLNNYVDILSKKDSIHADIEVLDFNECLQAVLHSVNSLIQSSKATIHINFNEVEKIKFNKAYLESVFLNLITNAIKYARPDRSPIISIYSKKVNEINKLIVVDNGLGFDMEKVKDKIFGLHQKFHDHKDSKGIGLYLVHSHITNLGGQIRVESSINEGTKFTISFKD